MMKRCVFFILFISLLFCQNVFSETKAPAEHRIGLGTGFFRYNIRDELASPLAYKGSGMPVEVSYFSIGRKNRHEISFSFIKSELSSGQNFTYGKHSVNFEEVNLRYGYLRRLTRLFGKTGNLFLGAQWCGFYSGRDFYYADDGIFESFKDLFISLDLSILFELNVKNKAVFRGQFSCPVVALVGRPNYWGRSHPLSFELTSLPRLIRLKNLLSFEYPLSHHFDISIKYEFIYFSFPAPQKVKSGLDHLSLGIMYTFGGE